jgi:hypothetical protein
LRNAFRSNEGGDYADFFFACLATQRNENSASNIKGAAKNA